MDALSEVLRLIRLQGALFRHGEFREPWSVQAPPAARMTPVLCPRAGQLAILHMVLEGRCWVRLPDGEAIELRAGDVATLPRGDAHLIGSGVRHAPVDLRHVVDIEIPSVAPLRYGGNGEATLLVCGWLDYERDVPNPLLACLPRLFRSAVGGRASGPWLQQALRHALSEAAASQPGSSALAARVAESLFVEAVRSYLEALPAQQDGWLAGLRDPQVGRCLALMHQQPARDWTVQVLAQSVHVSRSVLAGRFTDLVGVPPIQYLKRWRLAVAARMLCNDRAQLIQVAQAVGYESKASFSRAFKSAYGVAPGRWRSRGGKDQPAPGSWRCSEHAMPVDSAPSPSS